MRLSNFIKLAIDDKPKPRKQLFKWSCGPAVVSLALEHFGFYVPEKKIIKLMNANKKTGSYHCGFKDVFKAYNIPYREYNKANYEQLILELSSNNPVITDFYNEFGNHYVLVTNANNQGIEFVDTALNQGKYRVIPKQDFINHWYNTFTPPITIKRGWMISVGGKEKLALQGSVFGGDQASPELAKADMAKLNPNPNSKILEDIKKRKYYLQAAASAPLKDGKLPDHN